MFILHAQNELNINATNAYEEGQIALGDNKVPVISIPKDIMDQARKMS
jgi:hypothetical protein